MRTRCYRRSESKNISSSGARALRCWSSFRPPSPALALIAARTLPFRPMERLYLKTAAVVFAFLTELSAGTMSAADRHPIIEIETGYFFGASENGNWIKAGQAAKSTAKKTTYQVYSLTKQAGQISAGKPKSVDEPCPDTLTVLLSSKPKDGVIGLAAPWNALPRNPVLADVTQPVYVQAVGDFLKAHGIADPEVRITRIVRVDLDGDGEEEVLISATNYFTEDKSNHSAAPFPEAPIDSPRVGK
jgi:hypothetical protein